jgi:hypothetical protein
MRSLARSILLPTSIALLLTGGAASAQAGPPWTDWSVAAAGPDWRTWVAPDAGLALRLPPGHALAPAGDGVWYLHGHHAGDPTVPDATLRWLPGRDLEAALAETFGPDAIAEPWRFGDDATRGLRVVARGAGPDGTPYTQAGYLIAGEGGVLRLSRYEGFDWAPFHAVAGSLRWVRIVNGGGTE